MRLLCENDDDDVDEDYNNNGLRTQKIFSTKRCISKSYTKTEQSGGCSSVNYCKCVPLFHSLKFPLHNYFVYTLSPKSKTVPLHF